LNIAGIDIAARTGNSRLGRACGFYTTGGKVVRKRPVGLSVLPPRVDASRSALAATQRDFAELHVLDHPQIAHRLERNGQQYSASGERLDGEPLSEVLSHLFPERLEVAEADDIVRAIGSALVYAHGQSIVHGDVRAENVLVTMDRRFMLSNFLTRRGASVAGRALRPSDDVVALARLAAELYAGSSSPQALRAAAHSGVPAARLSAIRAVLENSSHRRSGTVAEFLAAAGLFTGAAAATARCAPRQERSWRFWRYVLPIAALIAIGTLVASYRTAGGHWGESVTDLQRRGFGALRAIATRMTPAAPVEATDAEVTDAEVTDAEAAGPGAPPSDAAHSALNNVPADGGAVTSPRAPETAAESTVEPQSEGFAQAAVELRPETVAKPAAVPRDPTVLSMGVPRIAVREDHTVVVIDIVRSGDTTRETSVGWWVAPGTAEPDEDYATGGRQVVAFPPGSTVQRVLIPIVDDRVREPNEVFTVHLSPPRNGVVGDVTATRVTVYDDD
jgi:hypothetical protein